VPQRTLILGRLDPAREDSGTADHAGQDQQFLQHGLSPSLSNNTPGRTSRTPGWSGVGLDGIEPSTSELSALRSNRLSYSPARDEQDYRTPEGRPNRGLPPQHYRPRICRARQPHRAGRRRDYLAHPAESAGGSQFGVHDPLDWTIAAEWRW
jgi:hypothetical protein